MPGSCYCKFTVSRSAEFVKPCAGAKCASYIRNCNISLDLPDTGDCFVKCVKYIKCDSVLSGKEFVLGVILTRNIGSGDCLSETAGFCDSG